MATSAASGTPPAGAGQKRARSEEAGEGAAKKGSRLEQSLHMVPARRGAGVGGGASGVGAAASSTGQQTLQVGAENLLGLRTGSVMEALKVGTRLKVWIDNIWYLGAVCELAPIEAGAGGEEAGGPGNGNGRGSPEGMRATRVTVRFPADGHEEEILLPAEIQDVLLPVPGEYACRTCNAVKNGPNGKCSDPECASSHTPVASKRRPSRRVRAKHRA